MLHGGLVRTLRIRTRRKLGNLGLLTTALGDAGASIGEIVTLKVGHTFTVRDFNLVLDDNEHLQAVLRAVDQLADCEVVDVKNPVRAVHEGGKVRTVSRVPLDGISALQTAISPGVAEIIGLIDQDPALADRYTAAPHTVAIISDGAGVRGVGKVRSRAMLPMLEAKAALLSSLAGLSSLPLVLDVQTEDQFVSTVLAISPSCSGILLDAVEGTRALRIIKRLADELPMPVFHDDADSPAIAGLAAVINACRRTGRDLKQVQIGQIGLGTAGGAIAELVMRYTNRAVYGEDVHPGAVGRHVSLGGKASSLEEIMATCDVVVCNTGHSGVIPPSLVREGQSIIALSEPRPEIEPYDAMLAGAAFAADGKAVNKAVVIPGIFLGALTVKASEINDRMRIAAARTLADAVAHETDLLPTPLDEHVHSKVAAAVARAAIESGLARRDVNEGGLTPEAFEEFISGRRSVIA